MARLVQIWGKVPSLERTVEQDQRGHHQADVRALAQTMAVSPRLRRWRCMVRWMMRRQLERLQERRAA